MRLIFGDRFYFASQVKDGDDGVRTHVTMPEISPEGHANLYWELTHGAVRDWNVQFEGDAKIVN
jgi:hypothetical protein